MLRWRHKILGFFTQQGFPGTRWPPAATCPLALPACFAKLPFRINLKEAAAAMRQEAVLDGHPAVVGYEGGLGVWQVLPPA